MKHQIRQTEDGRYEVNVGDGWEECSYEEFIELQKKYRPEVFIASTDIHDFDRLTDTSVAKDLLEKTIQFLNRNS